MQIKMFVQTNAGVASKPGSGQRNVRLVTVPPNQDGTNDNGTLFGAGTGAVIVDFQNMAPAEAAKMPEGALVTVTVDPA